MSKKPKNYVEPKEFFDEVLDSLRKGKMSRKLGEMVMLLAERRVNRGDFVRYVHIREDLIGLGIYACCKAFDKFNPYRKINYYNDEGEIIDSYQKQWNGEHIDYHHETCNNPYSFFNMCIYRTILQYLKKEYNQKNIINKIKVENDMDPEWGYQEFLEAQESKELDSFDEDDDDSYNSYDSEFDKEDENEASDSYEEYN